MTERTCGAQGCDRPVVGRSDKKFCGKTCSNAHFRRTDAGRAHKKRHRDRYRAAGKHLITVACTQCGEPCRKMRSNLRTRVPFCDMTCRDLHRLEQTAGDPFLGHRPEPPKRPAVGPHSKIPSSHPSRLIGKSTKVYYHDCAWCGHIFTTSNQRRAYCAARCSDRASRARRRGREHESIGSFTWLEFLHIAARFDYRCAYCGDKPDDLQAEHVIPISRHGGNTLTNILPSCMPCNADKRDLLLHEWDMDRQRRGLPPRATTWGTEDKRYRHLVITDAMLAAA